MRANVGLYIALLAASITGISCGKKESDHRLSTADSLAIAEDNRAHRKEMDDFMRSSPDSPFKRDTSTHYEELKWFPVDVRYRGHSVLHRYANPETVSVFGTKGEERKNLRYGYFEFDIPDQHNGWKPIRLNVYKFTPYDKKRFDLYRDNLSVWFTDQTTGKETYAVGRYVELGDEDADPNHLYDVDLNKAFNPYCAYSPAYSCAIPRKEDHLDLALRVGEKNYHPH